MNWDEAAVDEGGVLGTSGPARQTAPIVDIQIAAQYIRVYRLFLGGGDYHNKSQPGTKPP